MKLNIEKLLETVPITRLNHIEDNEVYSLLEKFNIWGAIKTKTVYWILKEAIESGKLDKSKTILEASSWNTAIALSYMANLFDFKVLLVIPESTASCKKKLIRSYWAEIIEVPWVTDDSIDYMKELYKRDPDKYFLTDQFNSYANMNAHYNLTWPYIHRNLGKLDFFVAGMWTTGTLLWTAKYLKEQNKDIKIIWINPLNKIEWIKDYNIVRNLGKFYLEYKYLIDEMIDVTFEDSVTPWLNDYLKEWYFNGISSAAILTWAKEFLKWKKWLKWLVVAPDWGDYYFNELFGLIDDSSIGGCK